MASFFSIAPIIEYSITDSEERFIKLNKYLFNLLNIDLSLFSIIFSSFLIITLSNLIKIFFFYVQLRFVYNSHIKISLLIFNKYLYDPKSWINTTHTSDLVKTIQSDVSETVNHFIMPMTQIMQGLSIFFVFSISFYLLSPFFFLLSFIGIIIFYFCYFLLVIKKVKLLGSTFNESKIEIFKIVQETFNGIIEILIFKADKYFTNKFNLLLKEIAHNNIVYKVISIIPRFIIEIVLIFLLGCFVIYIGEDLTNQLSTISVLLFGLYRTVPHLQTSYAANNQMKYTHVIVKNLLDKLISNKNNIDDYKKKVITNNLKKQWIEINNVYFNYGEKIIFKNLNFKLHKGDRVLIRGKSGVGKSTLIKLMLGLTDPMKGNINVLGLNLRILGQRNYLFDDIGIVSQNTFIIDDSIINNIILFEETNTKIIKKIKIILDVVCLSNFKDNLEYRVGEGGNKISSGQKQRLAIARLLYKNPRIIILDEATNALDDSTEKKLISNIKDFLNKDNIIIIISHKPDNFIHIINSSYKFIDYSLVKEQL